MEPKLPYYAGKRFARMDFSDGALPHVIGASNYQVTRANRAHPQLCDGLGHTYQHAPALTYWRGKFYLQYLSNPVDEHMLGGASQLCISKDGIVWAKPLMSFPVIRVPAGLYTCADGSQVMIPQEKEAFMHQRMAFFHSHDDRLLVTGFYGHSPHYDVCPFMNYGIGRAVREIYEDGSLGPIYFLRILEASGWSEEKLPYAHFQKSPDQGFVSACEELLADRLVTQQWADEHGASDEYVHLKVGTGAHDNMVDNAPGLKAAAFCWYHVSDRSIIGLWKHGLVGRSDDGGESWVLKKAYSFATSGGKSWGQRTADGRYAIAYINSVASEHRYPMVLVTSQDGIRYEDMAVIFGQTPPHRYRGLCKDFGPQYMRGICEGHAQYPKDAMWLCHSVNKEDIWVTRIPLPVRSGVTEHVNDRFDEINQHPEGWSLYSPTWASVSVCQLPDGNGALRLSDCDPLDYARAERALPPSARLDISLDLMRAGCYSEPFYIELTDDAGITACRVLFDADTLYGMNGGERHALLKLPLEVRWHTLRILADMDRYSYRVFLDGKEAPRPLIAMQTVNTLNRLVLRTKPPRQAPGMERLPEEPDLFGVDLPRDITRIYYVKRVETCPMSDVKSV